MFAILRPGQPPGPSLQPPFLAREVPRKGPERDNHGDFQQRHREVRPPAIELARAWNVSEIGWRRRHRRVLRSSLSTHDTQSGEKRMECGYRLAEDRQEEGQKPEARSQRPASPQLLAPSSQLLPYGITNSCCGSRTVSTGHGDLRTTFSATLPSSMCAIGPRPWVPNTIRSTPLALA